MGTVPTEEQPSEDGGRVVRSYELTGDVHLSTRASDLLALDHLVGFCAGGTFHGMSISKTPRGWLGYIKMVRRRKPLIAFWSGATYTDVLLSLGECLKGGYLYWKEDEHPSSSAKALMNGEA